MCFQIWVGFFLIRSYIASIWDRTKLVHGRHFNTQFYNFILPLLFLIFLEHEGKSTAMYVFASCGHCLPVIVGDLHKTDLTYTTGDVDG